MSRGRSALDVSAVERRGDNLEGFNDFYRKAKARIWPWLSYMCHIRSIAASVQFSIQQQLLSRNVKQFRGGLAFKAHRLLYHSTLGLRVIKKRRREYSGLLLSIHTVDYDPLIKRQISFFFFSTLKPRVEWYKSLWAFPHALDLRSLRGTILVTWPPKFRGNDYTDYTEFIKEIYIGRFA